MPFGRGLGLVISTGLAAMSAAVFAGAAAAASLSVIESVQLADTRYSTGDVAIASDGTFAIVAGDDEVQKVRIAPGPMQVLGSTNAARGRTAALHPNDRFGYILDDGGALHVVDVRQAAPRLVRTLSFGQFAPELGFDLAISPRGSALYVGYLGGLQALSLADPARPRKVGRVARPTKQYQGSIDVTPDGRQIISSVSHGFRNYLLRYDVSKPRRPKAREGTTALPFEPTDVAFSPNGAVTYVAGSSGTHGPGDVARLRTRNLKLLQRTADLPQQPNQIAVSPDGSRLYTAMSVSIGAAPIGALAATPLAPLGFFDAIEWPNGLSVSHAGATRGRLYVIHQQFDATSAADRRTLSALTVG